jgi:TolB-like protein
VVWYLQQYFGHIVEETGISGENHWSAASYWQTLSHNVISSTPRTRNIKVIDSNSTINCSCKITFKQ